jgi:hypothetical protein
VLWQASEPELLENLPAYSLREDRLATAGSRVVPTASEWTLNETRFAKRNRPATFDLTTSVDDPVVTDDPVSNRRALLRKDIVAVRPFLPEAGR